MEKNKNKKVSSGKIDRVVIPNLCTSLNNCNGDYCNDCSHRQIFGQDKVGNRVYRWSFNPRFGPLFLKADNSTPLKNQPSEKHPVWDYFTKWHERTL